MNLGRSMPPEKWMKSAVFRNFSLGVVVVALDTHLPTAEKNEDELSRLAVLSLPKHALTDQTFPIGLQKVR